MRNIFRVGICWRRALTVWMTQTLAEDSGEYVYMEDTQRKSPVKCMEDAHTHRTWRMRAVLDIGHTEDETCHCMEDMFKHTGFGE
jgi:hypothetical protein